MRTKYMSHTSSWAMLEVQLSRFRVMCSEPTFLQLVAPSTLWIRIEHSWRVVSWRWSRIWLDCWRCCWRREDCWRCCCRRCWRCWMEPLRIACSGPLLSVQYLKIKETSLFFNVFVADWHNSLMSTCNKNALHRLHVRQSFLSLDCVCCLLRYLHVVGLIHTEH